jgi:hypothetical protein
MPTGSPGLLAAVSADIVLVIIELKDHGGSSCPDGTAAPASLSQ